MITIIILLILAGVTIATITGNQGIIGRAKDAVSKYSQRQVEEQVTLLMHEYTMENVEKGTTLEDFLQGKKDDGTITDYKINDDKTADITKDGYIVKVSDNGVTGSTKVANSDSGNGGDSGSTTEKIKYTDTDGKEQELTKDTTGGTKIGETVITNSDNEQITLDWYLFDVSDDGKTAYFVSTPTYWVPDTTSVKNGAYTPKLVSNYDSSTAAMRQAIQSTKYNSSTGYSSGSVTYKPSDNTLSYFKSVNSDWAKEENARSTLEFSKWNENEQVACYLADADIFAGIKEQVNNAEGNLKGKIKTLVGGASAEQWCTAYNKQAAASSSKITCEYQATSYPEYIYKVNGSQSTVSNTDYFTGDNTIYGSDIYGAANKNGNTSNNPFYSWWWLASPSFNGAYVCSVYGLSSALGSDYSSYYYGSLSLFASVEL